jgi:alkaline phosphatase
MRSYSLIFFCILILAFTSSCSQKNDNAREIGNVIFLHPDGVGLAGWNAMRILYYGPDSSSNWDRLNHTGLYKSHLRNSIEASSNAGATIHAYGVKADYNSFGLDNGKPITSRSGKELTIMEEAKIAGIKTGIINSGSIIEPGSAVFVSSETKRSEYESITKKVIESGTDVILSGGEEWMLPEGVKGVHCESGKRKDGLNLIEFIKERGYTVVYNREELINLSDDVTKLLGVFAKIHTFNDKTEEDQIKANLPHYDPNAPTLADMVEAAIKILSKNGQQFFLVAEEEGTDNFGNKNNASGTLEALKRSDDAIGFSLNFMKENPNTLLIVASDSEASGMEVIGNPNDKLKSDLPIPKQDNNGAPYDGIMGSETYPFISAPDANGLRMPFIIVWSTNNDTYGSVVAKAEGLNADLMRGTIDNTDIYKIMYATLFGKVLK